MFKRFWPNWLLFSISTLPPCTLTGHKVAIKLDVVFLGLHKVQGGVISAVGAVVIVHIASEQYDEQELEREAKI